MKKMRRDKKVLKILTVVLCALMVSGNAFAAGRIMPTGKVTMYDGDKAIGQYSSEAPLPEDVTLVCSGKCAIETENLKMVAEDKTRFSVSSKDTNKVIQVKDGVLYFALKEMPKPITFATPHGDYTVQQVMINASAQGGVIEGYLKLDDDSAELGVHGGSMIVASSEGVQTIQDGKSLLLAQGGVVAAGGGAIGGGMAAGAIVLGTVAVVGVGAVVLHDDDDDDDDPVSPSNPTK